MFDSITLIIITLVTAVLGMISFTHMFQLNSYKPKEQLKWYKKNINRIVPWVIIAAFFMFKYIYLE